MLFLAIAKLWMSLSFYQLMIASPDGSQTSCNSFAGKNVLLINIATGHADIQQLNAIRTLKQSFGDSLAIILFPSNSFGHESRNSSEIETFCRANFGEGYSIASKSYVAGEAQNQVYQWLADSSKNATGNFTVSSDFTKILISRTGEIKGVFHPKIRLDDSLIYRAILNPE